MGDALKKGLKLKQYIVIMISNVLVISNYNFVLWRSFFGFRPRATHMQSFFAEIPAQTNVNLP